MYRWFLVLVLFVPALAHAQCGGANGVNMITDCPPASLPLSPDDVLLGQQIFSGRTVQVPIGTLQNSISPVPSGTVGGIPYYLGITQFGSTGALGRNQLLVGGLGDGPGTAAAANNTHLLLHGDNGASALPSWGALDLATELGPGVLPGSNVGDVTQGTVTARGGSAAVRNDWRAGLLPSVYDFNPTPSYDLADGVWSADTISVGSGLSDYTFGTRTFTNATAPAGDIGKTLVIGGASASGNEVRGTITAVPSSHTVTLSTAAGSTLASSSQRYMFGWETNTTAAFAAAGILGRAIYIPSIPGATYDSEGNSSKCYMVAGVTLSDHTVFAGGGPLSPSVICHSDTHIPAIIPGGGGAELRDIGIQDANFNMMSPNLAAAAVIDTTGKGGSEFQLRNVRLSWCNICYQGNSLHGENISGWAHAKFMRWVGPGGNNMVINGLYNHHTPVDTTAYYFTHQRIFDYPGPGASLNVVGAHTFGAGMTIYVDNGARSTTVSSALAYSSPTTTITLQPGDGGMANPGDAVSDTPITGSFTGAMTAATAPATSQLTISALTGEIIIGMTMSGSGVPGGTTITGQISGTSNGIGLYTTDASLGSPISAEAMTSTTVGNDCIKPLTNVYSQDSDVITLNQATKTACTIPVNSVITVKSAGGGLAKLHISNSHFEATGGIYVAPTSAKSLDIEINNSTFSCHLNLTKCAKLIDIEQATTLTLSQLIMENYTGTDGFGTGDMMFIAKGNVTISDSHFEGAKPATNHILTTNTDTASGSVIQLNPGDGIKAAVGDAITGTHVNTTIAAVDPWTDIITLAAPVSGNVPAGSALADVGAVALPNSNFLEMGGPNTAQVSIANTSFLDFANIAIWDPTARGLVLARTNMFSGVSQLYGGTYNTTSTGNQLEVDQSGSIDYEKNIATLSAGLVLTPTVAAGGTGWTTNQIATLADGCTTNSLGVTQHSATVRVTASGGVVSAVAIVDHGVCVTAPPNPVTTTGGSGLTLTVPDAGWGGTYRLLAQDNLDVGSCGGAGAGGSASVTGAQGAPGTASVWGWVKYLNKFVGDTFDYSLGIPGNKSASAGGNGADGGTTSFGPNLSWPGGFGGNGKAISGSAASPLTNTGVNTLMPTIGAMSNGYDWSSLWIPSGGLAATAGGTVGGNSPWGHGGTPGNNFDAGAGGPCAGGGGASSTGASVFGGAGGGPLIRVKYSR